MSFNGLIYLFLYSYLFMFLYKIIYNRQGITLITVFRSFFKYITGFVWIVVDVAIEDFNWYVMIMIIMMILIWDDVVNKDHVYMNCYYCWICEYEMRLLLLLITSLKWDDIYVVNDMEMECWLMLEMHWHVHVVYVRGWHCALTFQGLWH